MQTPLYDAHSHLADRRLEPFQQTIIAELDRIHCTRAVVNSTAPSDWNAVLTYAQQHPFALAAIGLHPWEVNNAPADWQALFLTAVDQGATVIGEIGLDQWVKGHDIGRQQQAFRWQLAQATARNLPVSIHCLRAIGPLIETLQSVETPKRGIHLHAYNGSAESVAEFTKLGAYFSFNAGQLKPQAKTVIQAIQAVPEARLLIETDAPNMLPPKKWRSYHLNDTAFNHPANLLAGYQAIADIRGVAIEQLAKQVETNFLRYFNHA